MTGEGQHRRRFALELMMEAAPTEVAPGRAGACLAGGAWGGGGLDVEGR